MMALRELTEADYPAIQALHRSVGWPQRSLAGWRWLHANPARREIDAPAGWVVDGPDGSPAAHIGNLIQRYRLGDADLYGANGFSIIVSPAVRGASQSLLEAFAGQPGVFAAGTFNANTRSQPLYARHDLIAWPPATHALKLKWPVDRIALVAGRVLREMIRVAPGLASGLGERLMNDRLGAVPRLTLPPGVAVLSDFRDRSRYADFWEALKGEGRLLADRGPEAIRWRLSDPDLTTPPLILAFNRGRDITGYAMAMMAKNNIVEAPVLEILDLEALAGETEAIPALMDALLIAAPAMGAAKVRMQMVSPLVLERLGRHGETARREGGWGHSHVRFAVDAPAPSLWSPTPYDGDFGVCLRPIPVMEPARLRARGGFLPTASKA